MCFRGLGPAAPLTCFASELLSCLHPWACISCESYCAQGTPPPQESTVLHTVCRTREAQAHPHATFSPALNARSRRLALARKARGLTASLHSSPIRSRSPAARTHTDECTFAPAVNDTTTGHLTRAGIPASFAERQQYYSQRRNVCTASLAAGACVLSECASPSSSLRFRNSWRTSSIFLHMFS